MTEKRKRGAPKLYTDERLNKLAESLEQWVIDCHANEEFRILGDWYFDNHVNPNIIGTLLARNERLKEAHSVAKGYQEYQVAKGALMKKLDGRFSTFFLGCQHNWRMKDEEELKKKSFRNDFVRFIAAVKGMSPEEFEESDSDSDNG